MTRTWCVLALLACAACADDPDMMVDPDPDPGADPDPDPKPMGTPSIAGTPVSSFETSTCSTGVVNAISKQVAEEVDCMLPGQLVPFEAGPRITITGSSVLPYLSSDARTALYAAVEAGNGRILRVNSAFRTVVAQYLLRRWFELGRCGITAAAEPGGSNHESGRALDIGNYNEWITLLGNQGWSHTVPGDPVHFDHLASPDIRGADVLAFQRLWNRNAPDDQIDEDGSYGPMTAARVKRAPAEGFGIGALCRSARLTTRPSEATLETPIEPARPTTGPAIDPAIDPAIEVRTLPTEVGTEANAHDNCAH